MKKTDCSPLKEVCLLSMTGWLIKEIKKRKSMKIRMNAFVLFCLLLSFLFRSLEIRSNDKSSSQNPTIDQLVQLLARVLHWRMWCNTGAKRCCTEERRTSFLCNFKSDVNYLTDVNFLILLQQRLTWDVMLHNNMTNVINRSDAAATLTNWNRTEPRTADQPFTHQQFTGTDGDCGWLWLSEFIVQHHSTVWAALWDWATCDDRTKEGTQYLSLSLPLSGSELKWNH